MASNACPLTGHHTLCVPQDKNMRRSGPFSCILFKIKALLFLIITNPAGLSKITKPLHLFIVEASSSTGVVKPSVDSVKKVPTFLPPIIVLMAFSCIPLHITTLTPRSKAQVAALTFESIPPVPTYSDNNSNTERRFIVETEEVTKPSSYNLSTCSST
uniref:Uncharacterized protein n=1 Tax=Glossina austeni TaxID=7395 RepID=A0A1A9UJJ9_GLOAU